MGRWIRAGLAALLVAGAVLAAVAWVNSRERAHRREHLARESRVVAQQFASRLRGALEHHLIALVQMANFFENSEDVTEEEFRRFASATRTLGPACLRICVVDPSFRIPMVYPLGPNRSIVGREVRSHRAGFETIERALRTGKPAVSQVLPLLDGPEGFVLAVPVRGENRPWIAVASVFRSDEFSHSVLLPQVLERYDKMILIGGSVLFAGEAFRQHGRQPPVPPAFESFELAGDRWKVGVSPRPDRLGEGLHAAQIGMWVLGILLALGAGGVAGAGTFWASTVRNRLRWQNSELRETRQRLDGTVEQLQQVEKLTVLGELLAGVAHEINNPLATILGYAQLMLSREAAPESRRRLETILSEGERMSRIVRDLLAFARKQPPEKRHLGLNGIVEKTLDLKVYQLKVRRITVERTLEDGLPMTMLDFQQIQQVVLNLLNNAEQAIESTGSPGVVRVATRTIGDSIELRVSDDGPGIPFDAQDRIFEPFFTTKDEGQGTGLGLSLCYGIVQGHGGTIRVESAPGKGATFSVELPIVARTTADEAQAAPPARGEDRQLRVLVIDDESTLQDLLVELLETMGHKADTASDAAEGVDKIIRRAPDVVLCDMRMPGGSGKDVYRRVCDLDPALASHIVFTTGDESNREIRTFLEETGNEVLPKPFTVEQLRDALARAVGAGSLVLR